MSPFADDLSRLVAIEAAKARTDPERLSEMMERLAAALGMTVALAAKGDPQMIDTLMTGAEAYAHSEAVEKGRIARLMQGLRQ